MLNLVVTNEQPENNKENVTLPGEKAITSMQHGNGNPDPRCRLCHRAALTTASPNIYLAAADFYKEAETEGVLIVDVCSQLLGIQYERHEFLPERVCVRCLAFLEDFYEQRKSMRQREFAMQQDLNQMVKLDPKYRAGLNGNPGEFLPEEGCVIVDVDPDQLCESSDDDFMGSDAEDEDDEEDDEEDAPIEEDADMPLGMDAAQMHSLMQAHQTVDASASASAELHPKSAFLCQYCDLAFTLQPDCQQHELSAHDPAAPYVCNYCQLRLTTRPALISHIKELHDPERPYVCAHCNKGFCRRSDLKKHTIVHTGVRPYTCNVCSKAFSRNTNLTKHLRIHSSVKPFVCQQCPRSFQTQLELLKHIRSHTEVKPFQCSRCPSSFARKDKLQVHQQVHDRRDVEQLHHKTRLQVPGQLPAEQMLPLPLPLHPYLDADYQQQQLKQPQAQQQLPKSSTKPARNFRCDVCDKGFQRERDLQRHRALHLDTLFACKLCGQGFNRREKLQRHELEAHGPSYTCDICCISFLYQAELETHLKVHKLQHSVAKSTQEALNAAALAEKAAAMAPAAQEVPLSIPMTMRPSAAELSFYSNMIPTMNLGFYSETRPEERNGI